MNDKKISLKEIGKTLLLTLVAAVLIDVLIDIQWTFFLSLVIFIIIIDRILGVLEEDSPFKRAFKKTMIFGAGIAAFVGLRIVIGYIFNMPLSSTYDELAATNGLAGSIKGAIPEVVLELLFLLPGAGIAYGIVNGGKKTKIAIYALSLILFFVVLWQVKQVNHSKAAKAVAQASIDKQTTDMNYAAMEKKAKATLIVGEMTEQFDFIPKGEEVAIVNETKTDGAEMMVKVVRKDYRGVYAGEEIFVPQRLVEKKREVVTDHSNNENNQITAWSGILTDEEKIDTGLAVKDHGRFSITADNDFYLIQGNGKWGKEHLVPIEGPVLKRVMTYSMGGGIWVKAKYPDTAIEIQVL